MYIDPLQQLKTIEKNFQKVLDEINSIKNNL